MKKIALIILMFYLSISSFSQTTDSLVSRNDSEDCERITKTVDEFTGEIKFEFSITDDNGGDVNFLKIIRGGSTVYYLSIYIKEAGIYTGTGVILILKNGKKINKPNAKVDYSYAGSSFYTTTFIRLGAEDIALLKQSSIEKYKLYISSSSITENPYASKDLFNCLLKVK